ncbi:hypothetical protein [Noviherbaspirillum malthae]|uniref:hypothetical protein n=1 Tax=Noviherbaspirillum malthae TaxID=1260987 RepID=UPI00188F1F8D|nr:hypothetical protein [Noviherbaspirillum malthae]
MTVAEPIGFRRQHCDDTRVVLDGFERGADDINTIVDAHILPNANLEPQVYAKHPETIPDGLGVGIHRFCESGGEHVVYLRGHDPKLGQGEQEAPLQGYLASRAPGWRWPLRRQSLRDRSI